MHNFCMKFQFLHSFIVFFVFVTFVFLYFFFAPLKLTSINVKSGYSYYVCTQIYDEPEYYLIDWLDYQFNVVGFKNVCVINTGQPLSTSLRKQFPIAYVEKKNRLQEFSYCLSSCFLDKPMGPEDMLMTQDIDEYLNVRKPDEIFKNHNKYDQFHFHEIRYGYVKETDQEMLNLSLRATNLWRKPHPYLGEYAEQNLKNLFKCKSYGGWPACEEGSGKEMIRVGAIKSLGIHSQRSKFEPAQRHFVDMKNIRLNHYIMRTKEDTVRSAKKWNKIQSRIGQIVLNPWFRIVFDDSILDSKRLI